MNTLLTLKNISKSYGKTKVLDDISLTIEIGEDFVILGPSGSGKTTLLQIMGGLISPTSGKIEILGKDINKMSDNEISDFRNKTIGFVFQNNYLQNYLTAKENVMIPMLIGRMGVKEAAIKAIELLDKVGMKDRVDNLPVNLSGGEEQRVAIARALANNPKVILADEPTAKLDKVNRDNVLQILKELNKDGISIICITHDEEYSKIFSETVKISGGKLSKII